jgi:hypothetical protein
MTKKLGFIPSRWKRAFSFPYIKPAQAVWIPGTFPLAMKCLGYEAAHLPLSVAEASICVHGMMLGKAVPSHLPASLPAVILYCRGSKLYHRRFVQTGHSTQRWKSIGCNVCFCYI